MFQLGDWSHHACSPVGLSVLICKIGGAERPVTEREPGRWGLDCMHPPRPRRWRHKRCGFDPWVGKIPWRRAWQSTSVFFLPGDSHGQRCLAGYSLWGCRESVMTEVTGHIKDLTQEQLDGRDAKDRVWGKELGFPCPLRGRHCPQSSTPYQPGSSLNPILLGFYGAFVT